MTKEKISSQEIIDLVATKASVSKRAAEEFLKVMITTIEEALVAGEVVKVKGFGTFKLQWNEPRKSVNVQTGEQIILDGYHKVTFTPETSLKELVNEPFAHLEPVQLDEGNNFILSDTEDDNVPLDPLRIFTEQASEIKDLLSEIQALSTPSKPQPEITSPSEKNEYQFEEEVPAFGDVLNMPDLSEAIDAVESIREMTAQQETPEAGIPEEPEIVAVPEPEPEPEPEIQPEPEKVREIEPEPEITIPEIEVPEIEVPVQEIRQEKISLAEMPVAEKPFVIPQETEPVLESTPFLAGVKPVKKRKTWLWISLSVLGILLLAGGGFYIYQWNQASDSKQGRVTDRIEYLKENVTIPGMVNSVAAWFKSKPKKAPASQTVVVPKDTVAKDTVEVKEPVDSLKILLDGPRVYTQYIATEQLKQGTRLTIMSEKYYGTKDFWVYIYEANKERIKDPDKVQIGTLIRIPKLDPRLIDASNPRCMQKARELHDEYVKKKL